MQEEKRILDIDVSDTFIDLIRCTERDDSIPKTPSSPNFPPVDNEVSTPLFSEKKHMRTEPSNKNNNHNDHNDHNNHNNKESDIEVINKEAEMSSSPFWSNTSTIIESDDLDCLIGLLKIPLQQRTSNQMVNIEEQMRRYLGEGNLEVGLEERLRDIMEMAPDMLYQKVYKGHNIYSNGDLSDMLYILLDGKVGIYVSMRGRVPIKLKAKPDTSHNTNHNLNREDRKGPEGSAEDIGNKEGENNAISRGNNPKAAVKTEIKYKLQTILKERKVLQKCSIFGECCLVSKKRRSATAIANTTVHLACLPRSKIITNSRYITWKIYADYELDMLFLERNVLYFKGFHARMIEKLWNLLQAETYQKGMVVVSMGEEANKGVWLVREGEFIVEMGLDKHRRKKLNIDQFIGPHEVGGFKEEATILTLGKIIPAGKEQKVVLERHMIQVNHSIYTYTYRWKYWVQDNSLGKKR